MLISCMSFDENEPSAMITQLPLGSCVIMREHSHLFAISPRQPGSYAYDAQVPLCIVGSEPAVLTMLNNS